MAVSESDRHELYSSLEDAIGKGPTETMMALLPPVGWADVATKHDLAELERHLVTRFDSRFERMEASNFASMPSKPALDAGRTWMRAVIRDSSAYRTALLVNIPTILASFALALAALRTMSHEHELLKKDMQIMFAELRVEIAERFDAQTKTLFRTFIVSNAVMILSVAGLAFGITLA